MPVTPTAERILHTLGRFHYLRIEQMVMLGIAKHRQTISRALKTIHTNRKPFYYRYQFGRDPQFGRLADLYALSQHGAEYLHSTQDSLPPNQSNTNALTQNTTSYPQTHYCTSNKNTFYRDYHHRKQTIHFLIQLEQRLIAQNGSLDNFATYYQQTNTPNGSKEAATRLQLDNHPIIPDLTGQYTYHGHETLFVGEIVNTTPPKRLREQLQQHLHALTHCTLGTKLNLQKGHLLFWAFNCPKKQDYFKQHLAELNLSKEIQERIHTVCL